MIHNPDGPDDFLAVSSEKTLRPGYEGGAQKFGRDEQFELIFLSLLLYLAAVHVRLLLFVKGMRVFWQICQTACFSNRKGG